MRFYYYSYPNKTRESIGQGVANVVTGFFGGMGGCAMIGQTMINVKNGARTRLSTFLAGVFLMVLCIALAGVVTEIPMAALVAVMVLVAFSTFDWHSVAPKTLQRMPKSEIFIMAVTVIAVVITENLAIGVIVGCLSAMMFFARKVAHLVNVDSVLDPDGTHVIYSVTGELFFASSNDLAFQFNYATDPDQVTIDLTGAHIWDASSVAALYAIETKYARYGKSMDIMGLNERSAQIHDRLAGSMNG